MAIEEDALGKLARARAQAVHGALIQSGADRARLAVAEPAPADGGKEGVPVTFAVRSK
jgi:hypothetical protein